MHAMPDSPCPREGGGEVTEAVSPVRANGHNIVDQQFPTLLDVTDCVRLHTLLHAVAGFSELLCKV